MSNVTYSQPFIILFTAAAQGSSKEKNSFLAWCLQPNSPAPNEAIVVNAYDPRQRNQAWVYGSDERIYLASTIGATPLCIDTRGGATANKTAIVLSPVANNGTQEWYPYSSTSPSTYIHMVNYPKVVIENDRGYFGGEGGHKVQVCEAISNYSSQLWTIWSPVLPVAAP